MRTSTIFHQILSEKEYFKKWKNIRKWQWTKKEQKDTWRLEFFFRNFGCQKKMSRRILKWIAILHLSPPDTQSRNSQRSPLFLFAGTQFIFAGNPSLCDACTASGVLASRIPDMCSDCLINAMAIDWAGFDRWRTLFGSHTVCNSPGDRMAFIQMVCVDPTESDRSPARWMASVLTEFLVAQLRKEFPRSPFMCRWMILRGCSSSRNSWTLLSSIQRAKLQEVHTTNFENSSELFTEPNSHF